MFHVEPSRNPASEPNQASSEDPCGPAISDELYSSDLIPDDVLPEPAADRFKHQRIAERVVDLLTRPEPPFNVALFGPWGSGKSSMAELVRAEIGDRFREKDNPPFFVRYDAWKLGGKGLHRNFILHAADTLGFNEGKRRYRRFHSGLYQTRRTVELRWSDILRILPVALIVAAAVFVVFAGMAALLVGAASKFTNEDFSGEISRVLPDLLKGAGILGFGGVLLAAAIRAGTTEVDQSAPNEGEEFTRRFRQLIQEATDKGIPNKRFGRRKPAGRIVFFVDELDRCSKADIIETLKSIRAFLDEENCVFIVAADRDVLEQAIEEVPQPTPANEVTPYYSSASAFLDKIFQNQIQLPPLRGRRLSRYADDLLQGRIEAAGSGPNVWRELQTAREGGGLLDLVRYALVPSHVRSPRRTKILLNAFAATARVAQSRGIEWPDRAAEVAKLVTLRTEFPRFAADLIEEPNLPSYFIDRDSIPEHRAKKVRRLIRKHETEGPDEYIVRPAENGDLSAPDIEQPLREEHVEQLRRYLERVADIPNPRRDLTFLEPAGEVYGLLDPDLGDRIERDAPDIPDEVVGQLRDESVETQRGALRLLADMVEELRGTERERVMSVLMGLVDTLCESATTFGEAAVPVANGLRAYLQRDQLRDEHLIGALRVALEVDPDRERAREIVQILFEDGRLLETSERTAAVSTLTDHLARSRFPRLREAIARHYPDGEQVVLRPLAGPEPEERVALNLIDSDEIWTAIDAATAGAGDEEERLARLQAAALDRESGRLELAFLVQGRLLGMHRGLAYQVVREYAEVVLAVSRPKAELRQRILRAWRQAPDTDWSFWSQQLTKVE